MTDTVRFFSVVHRDCIPTTLQRVRTSQSYVLQTNYRTVAYTPHVRYPYQPAVKIDELAHELSEVKHLWMPNLMVSASAC